MARSLKKPTPKAVAKTKRPGPPVWLPSDEERELIAHYVAIGYTLNQISHLVGKSVDSLQRHCPAELALGKLKADAQVTGKLFSKCMAGDTTSIIFWTKTRMGWREKDDPAQGAAVTFNVYWTQPPKIRD